jgi:Tfp pilus assembly protein PilN
MTQKVNLYESMVAGGNVQFGVSAMLKVWAVAGLLLLVASAYVAGRAWLQNEKIAALQQDKEELSTQLDALAKRAASWTEDPSLVAGVQKLEAELESKGRLLGALANETVGTTDGFSPFLLGLARRHVNGLWLQEIEIEESGKILDLKGRAIAPEAVPEFLEVLGQEPAFAGREFKTFALELAPPEEDAGPVISFVLSTEDRTGL